MVADKLVNRLLGRSHPAVSWPKAPLESLASRFLRLQYVDMLITSVCVVTSSSQLSTNSGRTSAVWSSLAPALCFSVPLCFAHIV